MGFSAQTTFGFDIEPEAPYVLLAGHHSPAKAVAMRDAANDPVRPDRTSVAGARHRNMIETQLAQCRMSTRPAGRKFLSTLGNSIPNPGGFCWMQRLGGS